MFIIFSNFNVEKTVQSGNRIVKSWIVELQEKIIRKAVIKKISLSSFPKRGICLLLEIIGFSFDEHTKFNSH